MALGVIMLSPPLSSRRILNLLPKICVPRSAKMPRKRKSSTRSEKMASIELISEASRFCKDFQYLWVEEGQRRMDAIVVYCFGC